MFIFNKNKPTEFVYGGSIKSILDVNVNYKDGICANCGKKIKDFANFCNYDCNNEFYRNELKKLIKEALKELLRGE